MILFIIALMVLFGGMVLVVNQSAPEWSWGKKLLVAVIVALPLAVVFRVLLSAIIGWLIWITVIIVVLLAVIFLVRRFLKK